MYKSLNFKEKLGKFSDHWQPRIIAEINDYEFKLVKIQGEFIWHEHGETDEVFVVIDGEMSIEFRDGVVTLKSGEMFVVPRGVEHKPVAQHECKILLIEPKGTLNTGSQGGDRTVKENLWV